MANSPRGLLPPLARIDPSDLEGEFDTGDVHVDVEEEENSPQLNIEDAAEYIQVDDSVDEVLELCRITVLGKNKSEFHKQLWDGMAVSVVLSVL